MNNKTMTNQKTQETKSLVFIVGAGASTEVDLPTGHDLKKDIAKALHFYAQGYSNVRGNNLIHQALHQIAQQPGKAPNEINDYLIAAQLIHDAMPQAPSIDNFIDSHRENERVAECGKLAIAACILEAEKKSKLYVDRKDGNNKIKFSEVSDTWFNGLFQIIAMNAKKNDLEAQLQEMSVISFNYDRCLEHYLHQSLQNYYKMDPKEAMKLLNQLSIFHPYGTVGNLPDSGRHPEIGYGSQPHIEGVLRTIAEQIKTFTEGTDEKTSEIEEIQSTIQNAKRIVFLGFAYHDLNLKLLYGQNNEESITPPQRTEAKVYGTARDISESNREHIIKELERLGGYQDINIKINGFTASDLLKEHSRSLTI